MVYGKTITSNEFFNLQPRIRSDHWKNVTGYLRCDELVEAVKTSKDAFNRHNPAFWHFSNRGAPELLETWLGEIGELDDGESASPAVQMDMGKIEKQLNKFVNRFPDLAERLKFVARRKKPTPILDGDGDERAVETETGQMTTGTKGGENEGSEETTPTLGSDDLKGAALDDEGDKKAKTKKKRVKGLTVSSLADPNNRDPIWFDSTTGTFMLNESHPGFRQQKQGTMGTYVVHVMLDFLRDILEDEEVDLWALYETWGR